MAVGSGARSTVDELHAGGFEARHVALQVIGTVRDVVEGLSPLREEASNGGVGSEWLEQLHGAHEGHADACVLDGLGRGTAFTGDEFEEATALFDGVNGDGHVVQGPVRLGTLSHGRMLTFGSKERQGEAGMATSETITEITDANFADEIENSEGLHMIDFWAVWCGPCRLVAPIVDELAGEYRDKGLKVGKLDVDSNPRTTARFRVMSIPSILFFKNGELVDQVVGAVPKPHLEEKIKQHL